MGCKASHSVFEAGHTSSMLKIPPQYLAKRVGVHPEQGRLSERGKIDRQNDRSKHRTRKGGELEATAQRLSVTSFDESVSSVLLANHLARTCTFGSVLFFSRTSGSSHAPTRLPHLFENTT
ncbi:hypothetical protein Bbelb_195450 [Branchiostoma belcheri]|nr:hypothetical protein Bbelb_195450 [Branchiostoma belcheri]